MMVTGPLESISEFYTTFWDISGPKIVSVYFKGMPYEGGKLLIDNQRRYAIRECHTLVSLR